MWTSNLSVFGLYCVGKFDFSWFKYHHHHQKKDKWILAGDWGRISNNFWNGMSTHLSCVFFTTYLHETVLWISNSSTLINSENTGHGLHPAPANTQVKLNSSGRQSNSCLSTDLTRGEFTCTEKNYFKINFLMIYYWQMFDLCTYFYRPIYSVLCKVLVV